MAAAKRSIKPSISTNAPPASSKVQKVNGVANILQHLVLQCKGDKNELIAEICKNRYLSSIVCDKNMATVPGNGFMKENAFESSAEREIIFLNGIMFFVYTRDFSGNVSSNSNFLSTIQEVLGRFAETAQITISPKITMRVLVSQLNRCNVISDIFFKLNESLFTKTSNNSNNAENEKNSSNFLFVPLPAKILSSKKRTPPTTIELFTASNGIHATISTVVPFGLFLRSHLNQMGSAGKKIFSMKDSDIQNNPQSLMRHCQSLGNQIDMETDPIKKPWIFFQVAAKQRISFGSETSVRIISLKPEKVD